MNRQSPSQRNQPPDQELVGQDAEALVQQYLDLPAADRGRHFANTAEAAQKVGRSQRTIQRWIEAGLIHSISIVGREMVLLKSLYEFVKREARGREQAWGYAPPRELRPR